MLVLKGAGGLNNPGRLRRLRARIFDNLDSVITMRVRDEDLLHDEPPEMMGIRYRKSLLLLTNMFGVEVILDFESQSSPMWRNQEHRQFAVGFMTGLSRSDQVTRKKVDRNLQRILYILEKQNGNMLLHTINFELGIIDLPMEFDDEDTIHLSMTQYHALMLDYNPMPEVQQSIFQMKPSGLH